MPAAKHAKGAAATSLKACGVTAGRLSRTLHLDNSIILLSSQSPFRGTASSLRDEAAAEEYDCVEQLRTLLLFGLTNQIAETQKCHGPEF
jgi:phosphoenolpyruvate carboxylase